MICDCLRDCLCRFKVNSQGSKIGQFWAYSPWFWTWPIFLNSSKSLQTLWNASKAVLKWFVSACKTVFVDLVWIRKGRKLADLELTAWAIAHGFEHGRSWQFLEIARHSQKRLQNRSKMIYDCFRDCLCLFRTNPYGSKIGRFWAKYMGYSPCLWTWPILASPGNGSKLSEIPPKPF